MEFPTTSSSSIQNFSKYSPYFIQKQFIIYVQRQVKDIQEKNNLKVKQPPGVFQSAFTCSKLTTETQEQNVKSVQS